MSYPAATDLTSGVSIMPLNPTVSGIPTSFSVAPVLPAGLSLNTTTGVITGTPTAGPLSSEHVITATNAGGSTNYTLAVIVYFRLNVAYPANYTFVTGLPVLNAMPTVTNGSVTAWSIAPALPPGLTFDTSTGSISGTPTTVSAGRNYSVTAQGVGGDAFSSFRAEVMASGSDPNVLVDFGHTNSVVEMEMEGDRLQSRDADKKIMLWDVVSGQSLRSAYSDCAGDTAIPPDCSADSDLAGPTLAVRVHAGWDLFAAADGAYIMRIPQEAGFDGRWSLAGDGGYLLAQGSGGIKAYSTSTGAALLTRTGNYADALIFAGAGEIRVGNAPSGAQTLELITLPGGTLTTATFAGDFHSWFADGEKFFTTAGSTARIYSRAGSQLDIAALPTTRHLRGRADWYWTTSDNGTVNLYAVGSGGVPATTDSSNDFDVVASSGPELLLRLETSTTRTLKIINLSGAAPVTQAYTAPLTNTYGLTSTSANRRAFAASDGVLWTEINGNSRVLSHGRARSLSASSTRVAIATAAGEILVYDAQTGAYLDTIAQRSSKVVLSADGSVLAAGPNLDDSQYDTERTTRVYALPSKNLIHSWPATFVSQGPSPFDVTLSPVGDRIGISVRESFVPADVTLSIFALDGTVVWTNTRTLPSFNTNNAGMRVNFSPNGTRHAAADGAAREFRTGTNLYLNASLEGAATGWPVGWLDEGRLLLNRYNGTDYQSFTGVEIVDPTGVVLSTPALPQMWQFQPAGPQAIYSPEYNQIFDTSTGDVIWSSEAPSGRLTLLGAVGAGNVFFASGSTIRMEPYE